MLRPSLGGFGLLLAGPLSAQPWQPPARGLTEDLRVEITVGADASLDVTETARLRPPGDGVVQRRIVTTRNPQALGLFPELFSLFAHVRVLSLTLNGRPASFSENRRRGDRELLIDVRRSCSPSCVVVLRYRCRAALGFFETDDELAWRIGGTDWNTPIESLSARVRLPPGTKGLRVSAVTSGYRIAERDATHAIAGGAVEASTDHPLQLFEYLHLTLNWNKGSVDEPSLDDLIVVFFVSNTPLLLPFAMCGLMYGWWHSHGRDPRRHPIAARYEPPEGLTPAEAGTLIDNSADRRDFMATLVDLAVRGHLRLQQVDGPEPDSLPGELLLVCRTPAPRWGELLPHERKLLGSLFADGEQMTTPAARLDSLAVRALVGFGNAVFRRLNERGYYLRRPDLVRASYQSLGVLVALAGFPARGPFYNWFGANEYVTLGAAVLSGAVLVVWGRYMPARTLAGARACEAVLGLEEFLSRVEADRLARVRGTPGEFQRLLPYAVAFGVEENWTRAVTAADVDQLPPEQSSSASGAGVDHRRFLGSLALLLSTSAASPAARRRVFRR